MRQLIVDLERVTVGIGEVEAALIDVVGGAQDLDAIADKVGVGVTQTSVTADLEGDVSEADLAALRALRRFGFWMLADVEGVEVVAQCHEHAPVVRVFLGDHKAQHIAVKPLRGLLVGDSQIDMADALQLDHGGAPSLSLG